MVRKALASQVLALLLARSADGSSEASCLIWRGDGCHSIRNESACLNSRDGGAFKTWDGLKVQGEPCVWCGGKSCTSKNDNRCEPYDWLVHGLGRAFAALTPGATNRVANCEDGRDISATLASEGLLASPVAANSPEDAFVPLDGGDNRACRGTSPTDIGEASNGKTSYRTWSAATLEECKGICVQQNGCTGLEYMPADRTCKVWQAPIGFSEMFPGVVCYSYSPQALCKNTAACAKLAGLCCPSKEGVMLGCCSEQAPEEPSAPSLALGARARTQTSAPTKPSKPANTPLLGASAPLGVVQAPTLAPVGSWRPERPSEEDAACLTWAASGCGAIRDRGSCLASRDGRDALTFEGLKIQGEPCVWCGGGACTSNNDQMCAPYDYLVNGEGKAFMSLHARGTLRVASCKGGVPTPQPAEQLSCLSTVSEGCSSLRDMGKCLNSRDGRDLVTHQGLRIRGEPCVWCGGGLCHSGADTLCEPFDIVMNGEGKIYDTFHARGTYKVAGCEGQLSKSNLFDPNACLRAAATGCNMIRDRGTCLNSRDGRDTATYAGLRIRGEPCVWCGGGNCHSSAETLCEPLDYLMRGEGRTFNTFHARGVEQVASCEVSVAKPQPPKNLKCLNMERSGCNSIRDMSACLSSRDGRNISDFKGLRVHGEPCVWCGGGLCHSNNDNKCEPFDFLLNGEGKVFNTFHARGAFRVAACQADDHPISIRSSQLHVQLPTPEPVWRLPRPTEGQMSCLRWAVKGCSSLRDERSCLGSRDGAGVQSLNGLQVENEPCVWCGGGLCTSNDDSQCLPYDYAMYGEFKAFVTFHARGSYSIAACQEDRLEPFGVRLSSGLSDTQLPIQAGVFRGPLADHPKVVPPVVPLHDVTEQVQHDFGRCGGKGWYGPTACAAGSQCISTDGTSFPVCVPAPPSADAPKAMLLNEGRDCWASCGNKAGYCSWCGAGNACCRQGFGESDPTECRSASAFFAGGAHHECVMLGGAGNPEQPSVVPLAGGPEVETTAATTSAPTTPTTSAPTTPASTASVTTATMATSSTAKVTTTIAVTTTLAETTAATTIATTTISTATTATTTITTITTTTTTKEPLILNNEGCLPQCGGKDGFCAWCGIGNACCRPNALNSAPECHEPLVFKGTVPECVTPAVEVPVVLSTKAPTPVSDAPVMSQASYRFHVDNVDFPRLQLDQSLFAAFQRIVKGSVALTAGQGAQPEDVSLGLQQNGDVQATILARGPNSAHTMETRLCDSKTLTDSMAVALTDLPGMTEASTGFVSVKTVGIDDARSCPQESSSGFPWWAWMLLAIIIAACISVPLIGYWFDRKKGKGFRHQRLMRNCLVESEEDDSSEEWVEDSEAALVDSQKSLGGKARVMSVELGAERHSQVPTPMQFYAPGSHSSMGYGVQTQASGLLPMTQTSMRQVTGLPPTTAMLPEMPATLQSLPGADGYGGDYDLVTVTPQGLQVHHLHGAPPPPGVPIVAGATVPVGVPIWEDNA